MNVIIRIIRNWRVLAWNVLSTLAFVTWPMAVLLVRRDMGMFHILLLVLPFLTVSMVFLIGLRIAAISDPDFREFCNKPHRTLACWGSLPVVLVYWIPRGILWLVKKYQ